MKKSVARTKIHKSGPKATNNLDRAAPLPMPPALALIAAGRDHIITEEFARAASRKGQTVRKNYCTTGECFGIRPLKFGNRLLWPVIEIAKLLNGETAVTGRIMPSRAPNDICAAEQRGRPAHRGRVDAGQRAARKNASENYSPLEEPRQ
jgi:hypothetical protein